MSDNDQNYFLGSGWGFPPTFDLAQKEAVLVNHESDINESLYIILSTTPGERTMNPKFGCGLKTLIFENITQSTVTIIEDMVSRAILYFEPRISLQKVSVDLNHDTGQGDSIYDGVVHINIEYIIRQTNTRSNMVYPFYFNEADSDLRSL